jgi:hypothetical protein
MKRMVLVFLLTLGAVQAHASYLFGLTDKEIDEVMTYYYPRGYDRDAALRQMSEPFDCKNFGDLCTEVGERYALRIVESGWLEARKRYPIEMIDRAAEHDLEYYGQLWFDSLYPQGVPAKDPYWVGDGGTECTGTGFADSGDFRVVHTSRRHTLVVLAWGRVKVEHFKRNLAGNYELKKADKLQVEGTIFFKATSAPEPFSVDVGDEKEDAKRVAAFQPHGGVEIVSVPFVEGCGGVPGTLLWACSCIGAQP